MKRSRGGNPSKRAANGSKTTPKSSAPELSAAGSGSGLPSQGSSEDPFPIGECPYGLVGNIAKVPGTWWGGFYKGDDRKRASIVDYYPVFQFSKGKHQAWVLDVAEDDQTYPCSYYDICHFLDAADRPSDYVPSDDEDADRDEVSDEDDGSEDSKPKKKKSKAPATTAVKKDRTYINENNYCLQFRWNLFDQMAAVARMVQCRVGSQILMLTSTSALLERPPKGNVPWKDARASLPMDALHVTCVYVFLFVLMITYIEKAE